MSVADLYNALRDLREAKKALDDARSAYSQIVMQRKRKGKQEAWEARYEADKRVVAAREAADELLARYDPCC